MALPITINDLLVTSDQVTIDLEFFNTRYTAIMAALNNIDGRMSVYDGQVSSLVTLGLQRLNDAMGPMLTTLQEASNLGFLVCKSEGIARQLTLGSAIGWSITSGADIFTPTPFVLAQDETDSTNWGILSIDAGGWVQSAATLATHVVYTTKTQSSNNWVISANSAFVPAMQTLLSQAQSARNDAVNADADVTAQMASLASLAAAVASGPVSSVAGKTGVVTLVEGDIANLVSDLAAKASLTAMNTGLATKQNSSANLTALAAMTWVANQLLLTTGAGTITAITISAFMQGLLATVDAPTMRTNLGIPVAASSSDISTGTDNTRFVTAAALSGALSPNPQTTAYTLQQTDHKRVLTYSNTANANLTLPATLPLGFECTLVPLQGGNWVFVAATNATIHVPPGGPPYTKTGGGWRQCRLIVAQNSDGAHAVWSIDGSLS